MFAIQVNMNSSPSALRFTLDYRCYYASRGVVLLMYSPIRDCHPVQRNDVQELAYSDMEARYQAESELVMKECIRPWLRLVHSITPGAPIVLACSHLESPPPGDGRDIFEWSQHVQRLAGYVFSKVYPPCHHIIKCSSAEKDTQVSLPTTYLPTYIHPYPFSLSKSFNQSNHGMSHCVGK